MKIHKMLILLAFLNVLGCYDTSTQRAIQPTAVTDVQEQPIIAPNTSRYNSNFVRWMPDTYERNSALPHLFEDVTVWQHIGDFKAQVIIFSQRTGYFCYWGDNEQPSVGVVTIDTDFVRGSDPGFDAIEMPTMRFYFPENNYVYVFEYGYDTKLNKKALILVSKEQYETDRYVMNSSDLTHEYNNSLLVGNKVFPPNELNEFVQGDQWITEITPDTTNVVGDENKSNRSFLCEMPGNNNAVTSPSSTDQKIVWRFENNVSLDLPEPQDAVITTYGGEIVTTGKWTVVNDSRFRTFFDPAGSTYQTTIDDYSTISRYGRYRALNYSDRAIYIYDGAPKDFDYFTDDFNDYRLTQQLPVDYLSIVFETDSGKFDSSINSFTTPSGNYVLTENYVVTDYYLYRFSGESDRHLRDNVVITDLNHDYEFVAFEQSVLLFTDNTTEYQLDVQQNIVNYNDELKLIAAVDGNTLSILNRNLNTVDQIVVNKTTDVVINKFIDDKFVYGVQNGPQVDIYIFANGTFMHFSEIGTDAFATYSDVYILNVVENRVSLKSTSKDPIDIDFPEKVVEITMEAINERLYLFVRTTAGTYAAIIDQDNVYKIKTDVNSEHLIGTAVVDHAVLLFYQGGKQNNLPETRVVSFIGKEQMIDKKIFSNTYERYIIGRQYITASGKINDNVGTAVRYQYK